ncbi:unnamed protein product [Vitrella brassicaformis CCMP3155]|uniref:Uncharacterized protein n=1 Tax=Vitrella brassicaformis (strain CCMP3155) TaxID=1169540 RepID=A0A0G4E9B4_VITBC|nr:unnamed protein product [Vitrella brassicaformis CCMP3155]|eukprot:CEL92181.1 unnamed protein product [Vitrella brassicaformis CCMP3155]
MTSTCSIQSERPIVEAKPSTSTTAATDLDRNGPNSGSGAAGGKDREVVGDGVGKQERQTEEYRASAPMVGWTSEEARKQLSDHEKRLEQLKIKLGQTSFEVAKALKEIEIMRAAQVIANSEYVASKSIKECQVDLAKEVERVQSNVCSMQFWVQEDIAMQIDTIKRQVEGHQGVLSQCVHDMGMWSAKHYELQQIHTQTMSEVGGHSKWLAQIDERLAAAERHISTLQKMQCATTTITDTNISNQPTFQPVALPSHMLLPPAIPAPTPIHQHQHQQPPLTYTNPPTYIPPAHTEDHTTEQRYPSYQNTQTHTPSRPMVEEPVATTQACGGLFAAGGGGGPSVHQSVVQQHHVAVGKGGGGAVAGDAGESLAAPSPLDLLFGGGRQKAAQQQQQKNIKDIILKDMDFAVREGRSVTERECVEPKTTAPRRVPLPKATKEDHEEVAETLAEYPRDERAALHLLPFIRVLKWSHIASGKKAVMCDARCGADATEAKTAITIENRVVGPQQENGYRLLCTNGNSTQRMVVFTPLLRSPFAAVLRELQTLLLECNQKDLISLHGQRISGSRLDAQSFAYMCQAIEDGKAPATLTAVECFKGPTAVWAGRWKTDRHD